MRTVKMKIFCQSRAIIKKKKVTAKKKQTSKTTEVVGRNKGENLFPWETLSNTNSSEVAKTKDKTQFKRELALQNVIYKCENVDEKSAKRIIDDVLETSNVSWADIAGLDTVKTVLKERIVHPMANEELFRGIRSPDRGILLYGPPGTGKTLIGKCLATQCNATFFNLSAASLTSKWQGEGEKMVRTLFQVARALQPSIIFIDEIDSLLSARGDREHESSRRMKTEFLVQLEGCASGECSIYFIGATNLPQELDQGIRRRFTCRLYIPLPDEMARKQFITHALRTERHSLSEEDVSQIAEETERYSGADLKVVCREAAFGPLRDSGIDVRFASPKDIRGIEKKDFDVALSKINPSNSSKDIKVYLEFDRQFGTQ